MVAFDAVAVNSSVLAMNRSSDAAEMGRAASGAMFCSLTSTP
jgi:hypothetical protein